MIKKYGLILIGFIISLLLIIALIGFGILYFLGMGVFNETTVLVYIVVLPGPIFTGCLFYRALVIGLFTFS